MAKVKRATAVVISGVLAAAIPTMAWSQDNPPIDVPTEPVPQGQPPPPTNKPQPPAPPPQPTTGGGGGGGGGATGGGGGGPSPTGTSTAPPAPTSFNNEGVFKISGTKGPGIVGGPKSSSSTAAPTGTAPPAKPKGKVFVAAKPKEALAVAEWPGFRMLDDGGSEVMVEFSKPITAPTEHKAAGTITYIFKGAHLVKYNNANPLLTIHFNTPVLDARLVQKKGGELHLVVDLRPGLDLAPVVGQRVATDQKGQQFFVRFPAGSYLPLDEDDNKKPDAKTEQGKTKTPAPSTTTKKPASGGSGPGPQP
jgi:hypothetical protein